MNKLEAVVLDQHMRVKSAGENPLDALDAARGEILSVATLDMTIEIMADRNRTRVPEENSSLTATMRAMVDPASILERSVDVTRNGHRLAQMGMFRVAQGYIGGILFHGKDRIVFGNSMAPSQIKEDDVIQEAMKPVFYPPMMWVKALRAEAYRNRPESARQLSTAEYLAKLGLSLGAQLTQHGDVIGATGFMPGPRLQGEWGDPVIDQQVSSESIEAFQLSGMCDQAVLDPGILVDKYNFGRKILELSGSLN